LTTKTIGKVLLAATLVLTGAAFGGDKSGNFAIRGAGMIDCNTYLQEKEQQSQAYIMIGGWIDGYLTATNQLSEETYDITSFQSTELLATVLQNHCETNGDHRLFTVLSSIAAQLKDDRLVERSETVTVQVDDKSTRLYSETIRRMQSRLKEAAHYQGGVTGRFDAATLAAVKAYQESIGYTPTGFPDQATLWKLFADQ
jgi:hypothetical protein